jgi:ACR3 family arsenite transporter
MSTFERYLTVWVFLCIVVGIALGHGMPGVFHAIGAAEIAKVNIPVAALIWLMVIPMLLKIDFSSLAKVGSYWRGIGVTLFVNWAVSRSRWHCSAGYSSDRSSALSCPKAKLTPTSRA